MMRALEPRQLAGYRIVRTLARGSRCELLLGYDDEDETTVVLKIVRGATPDLGAGRELVALERAAGAHVVGVVDAARLEDGTHGSAAIAARGAWCLVLERLGGPDLSSLLGRRSSWDAGEIVTLLAPIAATIARLHERGVAHGSITPSHLVLSSAGAPTLVGFGNAGTFEAGSSEAARAAVPAVQADRRALRSLALRMLEFVADRRAEIGRLAEALAHASDHEIIGLCATELFDLAAASPIRPDDLVRELPHERELVDRGSAHEVGARSAPGPASRTPAGNDIGAVAVGREASSTSRVLRVLLAGALPDRWIDAIGSVAVSLRTSLRPDRILGIVTRARDRWGALGDGARRFLVAGASGAAALLLLFAVLPGESRAEDSATSGLPPSSGADDPALGTTEDEPVDLRTEVGSDPLDAAASLLELRARCYRDLSLLCLDAVAQDRSAALERDREAVRALREGGEARDPLGAVPSGRSALVLVERLGGSAIIGWQRGPDPDGHAETASVLLIQTEAGWRLRDYLAG